YLQHPTTTLLPYTTLFRSPSAYIVTPNQFELDYLSGLTSRTIDEAVRACGALQAVGPRTVLVTSLHVADTPKGSVDLLAVGPDRSEEHTSELQSLAYLVCR